MTPTEWIGVATGVATVFGLREGVPRVLASFARSRERRADAEAQAIVIGAHADAKVREDTGRHEIATGDAALDVLLRRIDTLEAREAEAFARNEALRTKINELLARDSEMTQRVETAELLARRLRQDLDVTTGKLQAAEKQIGEMRGELARQEAEIERLRTPRAESRT